MGQTVKNLPYLASLRMGFALLLGLVWAALFFLGAQTVSAHPSEAAHIHGVHDHGNHLSAQSPFEKHSVTPQPHCLLHKHVELPCPHEKDSPSKRTAAIGPECGGHPFGQIPASQNIQDNPPINDFPLVGLVGNSTITSLPVLCKYSEPEVEGLIPPPKLLS
jgi:hypothetical protein